MLFMLHIDVTLPTNLDQAEARALRERENMRALELISSGTLRRIWRVVGRTANYSVWEAESLEQLHESIQSQPMFPYMKIEVTPLVEHPVAQAWHARNGALPPF